MKNRLFIILAVIAILCLCLFGCGNTQTADLPDVGIDWDVILPEITEEKLAEHGLYADFSCLQSDVEDFGTVTFCNYDPVVTDSFKDVDYQLTVEYGLGYEYSGGSIKYYDFPVYSVMLVDNSSDAYYSCICTEGFELLSEEGQWFLTEDRDEFVLSLLENSRTILFGE